MRLLEHYCQWHMPSHSKHNAGILRLHFASCQNEKAYCRYLLMGVAMVCALAGTMRAQQLIGYVATKDADVAGAKDTLEGRAVLAGSVSVTAKDHTAPIELARGGTVRVCQTSVLHMSESREMMVAAPLLFSLDRGAIEIETAATPTDAVMTPDLRMTARSGGPLDLRLRVAANGDTCVENRGVGAPLLIVSDPFGDATYEMTAGQHVLFEHGSLHEVVDHETSPCGCPDEKGASMADALLAPPAAQHPFPVAISEGLAPEAEVPQAPPGAVHTQVSEALRYNPQDNTQAEASAPPPATPTHTQPVKNLAHVVGRFFRRIWQHV